MVLSVKEGAGAFQYQYDYNRLTAIDYPQNPENNVHYSYGDAGTAHNRAGRIVVQEATGAQEFFYGPLGEVVKNIRTIVIPQHGDQTYTTEWSYDTWNRLTEMVYPDGEKVEYSYNVGGCIVQLKFKINCPKLGVHCNKALDKKWHIKRDQLFDFQDQVRTVDQEIKIVDESLQENPQVYY